MKALQREGSLADVRKPFRSATEWLFVGCGSSYYLALAAAASWSEITGVRARAIPASELLLFPDLVLGGTGAGTGGAGRGAVDREKIAAVAISRSGRTSETVRAAQVLEREKTFAFWRLRELPINRSNKLPQPPCPCFPVMRKAR